MSNAQGTVVGSWIRRVHWWVSIVFTATVSANFGVRATGANADRLPRSSITEIVNGRD